MLRNVGRRLILYLVLTDALVPEPLVEDLVFEGPRAAHHALLDVGDGGGVLHNLDHSCNVATNLPSAIHPKLNGTPPLASGPPARQPTYSVAGGDAAIRQQAEIQGFRLPNGLHDQQDLTKGRGRERVIG